MASRLMRVCGRGMRRLVPGRCLARIHAARSNATELAARRPERGTCFLLASQRTRTRNLAKQICVCYCVPSLAPRDEGWSPERGAASSSVNFELNSSHCELALFRALAPYVWPSRAIPTGWVHKHFMHESTMILGCLQAW